MKVTEELLEEVQKQAHAASGLALVLEALAKESRDYGPHAIEAREFAHKLGRLARRLESDLVKQKEGMR